MYACGISMIGRVSRPRFRRARARDILNAPSEDELHVLIQASQLLTRFIAVDGAKKSINSVRERYRTQIEQVADRLILIAGSPPTPRNIEAQILLGSLAQYAFDIVFAQLIDSLRSSPLGFRAWRSMTKLLMISRDEENRGEKRLSTDLSAALRGPVDDAQELRRSSIYPGRSLDLELAIAVPSHWLGRRTVTNLLLARAQDPDATLRERGTAAMGIWQRAVDNQRHDDPSILVQLEELIDVFRGEQSDRPDIASGLRWVAATLEHAMKSGQSICNEWPVVEEPWFEAVQRAATLLNRPDIPSNIRPATINLFKHVLLQNSGVERRKAIDTLAAGGWAAQVAQALEALLKDKRTDDWIRIRAIFALGFMQFRNRDVRRALVTACKDSYASIVAAETPTHSQIHHLHAALFAAADCYGAIGAEKDARGVRDALEPILTGIVDTQMTTAESTRYPIARALVYLLTFMAFAPPSRDDMDLSQKLLMRLADHPDSVTADFCRWSLGFRFGPHGEVMPLLHSATLGL